MFLRLIRRCNVLRSMQKYSICNENHNVFPTVIVKSRFSTISTNFVEDKEKMQKILILEASVMRQEGKKVPDPDKIKPQHWEHLLTLKTRSARTKYYVYLWQIERKQESNLIKKEKRAIEVVEKKQQLDLENADKDKYLIYSLMHNSYFLRIYETTMNLWNNNKLSRAMQFAPKLVYDCSYDEHMTQREAINAAKQLMLCFADNRMHDEPFNLYYCNANMNGVTMNQLQRNIPTMMEPWFPLNIHSESYLDLFPKENLVYLTPHCRNDLMEYNPDDIYIVGAMVDKMNNEPLSLAKAKRQGLRMARLPLDHYLDWGAGSGKSLTLNQMISIMLDIKSTNSWEQALRHVPRRKILHQSEQEEHERVKLRWQKNNNNRMNALKFDVNNWGNSQKKRTASVSEQLRNDNHRKTNSTSSFKHPPKNRIQVDSLFEKENH